MKRTRRRNVRCLELFVVLVLCGCGREAVEEPPVTSFAYRGHERDADIDHFIGAYPEAAGTRLDDCVLCHSEGEVTDDRGRARTVSACDHCHHREARGEPLALTLNPFGRAWRDRGRNRAAFGLIEGEDSDGDAFTNLEEIRKGFFPGRKSSNPGKPAAPFVELTLAELRAMKIHRQFMLSNSHRQRRDDYVTYAGVRFSDLLESQGVDVDRIDGITVFAPDGFAKSYSREQVIREYPAGVFHAGLDDAALGDGKGVVVYPARMPFPDLADGDRIPGKQFLLLAFERDFEPIPVSTLDPQDGKIRGEGPFRSVRPQTAPARPDRGSRYPQGDEYDCIETLDHNAGDNVRGVTVIRVDPMPEELEEFDAMNASWRYVQQSKLVIYGFGIR